MALITTVKRFRYKFNSEDFYFSEWPTLNIDGLVINIDASVAASLRNGAAQAVDGDPVSEWRDQTANAYHATQGGSAAMPTYRATGFNGLPCVDFDPAGDYLAGVSSVANGASGLTILHVADLTLDGAYRTLFAIQAPSPYRERFSYFLNSYGLQQRLMQACRLDVDTQATLTSSGGNCPGGRTVESISIDYCSGAAHIMRNGVVLASSAAMGTGGGKASATAPNYYRIGAASGGAQQKVAQHIVLSRYCSQTEAKLHHYGLMAKWGISA